MGFTLRRFSPVWKTSSAAQCDEQRACARRPGTPRTVDDAAPAVGAAQLLLAHGGPHTPPLTGGLAADEAGAGACYQAAFHLASTQGLTYAEGYAYASTIEAVLPTPGASTTTAWWPTRPGLTPTKRAQALTPRA